MIYLASPYSHENSIIRELRYHQVLLHCETRMKEGKSIFSPIVYGHQFAVNFDFPYAAKTWEFFNFEMLGAANKVEVLLLDGWDESLGVETEIDWAQRFGKPLTYVEFNK